MNEPLPQGWAWATVGEVATEVRSGFASGKHNPSGDGIPHLRPMNVSRGGEVDLTKVKYVSQDVDERRLCRGDILFNNTNSPALVGKTALFTLDGEFAFSNHMTRVRTSEMVPGFISYQLHHAWMSGRQSPFINNHVNQASISARVLASQIQIAVAPVSEQRRIVDRIGEIFARLHAAETRLKSLLEKLDRLRSAILADALHTNRHTLPRGWVEVALSDVAQIILGQSPPGTSYNSTGDGVAFFQGKAEFGKLYPVAVKWTTKPKRLAKQNDILLSVRAPVGPTNLAPVDCAIGRGLHAIRPNTDIDHLFLLWALRASVGLLRDKSTGSTFNAVTGQQVKTHRISIPPLVEQTRLVKSIETQFSHLDTTVTSINYGLKLVATLRQSVLAEAFTGRLVPQDPDDEPASELLKRIAASRPTKPKRRRKARA